MSSYPISCTLCRHKKIKCNKRKPCNQCTRRNRVCEFPLKFRNVDVTEAEQDDSVLMSLKLHLRGNGADPELSRLNDEIELLRKEKLTVLHENFKLTQKNHELRSKLQVYDRLQQAELEGGIEISGETTELGEKYYGPLSLNFMIESLRKKNREEALGTSSKEKTPREKESPGSQKKRLPVVVDGPDNMRVLKALVHHFFEVSSYRSFIDRRGMFAFLDSYEGIPESEWENDDDLLLLHMVLILLANRLTPQKYDRMGLAKQPIETVPALNKAVSALVQNVLFKGFTRLRHNLLNESIMTVQAYILCTEWYFIEQKYEELWLMLFHLCAVAYAIGLHVMVSMRSTEDGLDKAPAKLAQMVEDGEIALEGAPMKEELPSDDDEDDVPRVKVWFALKLMCGQLCLILGRPNPILIQINSVVLFTSDQLSLSRIRLDLKNTQVQLKMGLSECLRLSNMMLIESFMMNFTIEDVMRLDARFNEELDVLAWFLNADYAQNDAIDEKLSMPVVVSKEVALVDLIVLHVNRAKLLEPFITQFIGVDENRYLLDTMCASLEKILSLTLEFFQEFLKVTVPEFRTNEGDVHNRVRLGRTFRIKYPFLNSFLYQAVIVIFTLLNYKAKEFVEGSNGAFLNVLEERLNQLLQLDSDLSDLLGQNVHLWSTNIIYLINKDLQHINRLLVKRAQSGNHEAPQPFTGLGFDQNFEDMDSMLGLSLRDRFWMANPENIPYYLSSPSDDGNGQLYDGYNKMEPQPRNMDMMYMPQQPMWNQPMEMQQPVYRPQGHFQPPEMYPMNMVKREPQLPPFQGGFNPPMGPPRQYQT